MGIYFLASLFEVLMVVEKLKWRWFSKPKFNYFIIFINNIIYDSIIKIFTSKGVSFMET